VPEQNQIRGDHGVTLNLTNIHNEYARAQRAARPALLEKYVAMMLPEEPTIPKLWTLAKQQLYVVVRSRFDYVSMGIPELSDGKPLIESVHIPWIGDLCWRLVYDLGPSVMLVSRQCLEEWGQNAAAASEQGLRNLAGLATPRWESIGEGVYTLVSEVSYEESLLLVPRVADRVPIQGPVVFIPVNRGVLLACAATSSCALEWMLDTARQSLLENPWPMGATLLQKIDGTWRPFVATGTAARKHEALQRINIGQAYDAQQERLQQYCDSRNDDVFVASFQLRQIADDADELRSIGTWTEGAVTLLPKTDIIALVRAVDTPQQESAFVDWDQVVAICGHRMQATDWDPPRIRLNDFPSDEEWSRLVAVAKHS
jgi:hypothetical protein